MAFLQTFLESYGNTFLEANLKKEIREGKVGSPTMQKDLCGNALSRKQELDFSSRDQHRTKTAACQITLAFSLPPDL